MAHTDLLRGVVSAKAASRLKVKSDSLRQRFHDEHAITADDCAKTARDPDRRFETLKRRPEEHFALQRPGT